MSGNTTISATKSGLNVIDATSFNLQGGSTLAFSGSASDLFVVRVSGALTTGGNSNIDSDGVGDAHVVFVVAGNVTMSGGTIDGTYLSSGGDITLSGGVHDGAYILAGAGKALKFQSAPTVSLVSFVPEPATLLLLCSGVAGLAVFGRTKRD